MTNTSEKEEFVKQTILITGCSTGFGNASARHFAARGWNVVATMRNLGAERGLSALENVLVVRLDVEDEESIANAIKAGIDRFGRINVLLNNAGFGLFGVFETTPREKIMEQFAVNVFGLMDVTRALLPHFRANRSGVILNVGSGAGVFGLPMLSLYTATKFALEGFSESLSYELAPLGIVVKIIEPGGVVSTSFGSRSGEEAALVAPSADYVDFVTTTHAKFGEMRTQRLATEDDVASVIYQAATDGTNQLRYVATDDIRPWVAARRESSEAEYMSMMRNRFINN
jgi:NAD(P)-dependent dehydrogenase (short-subunit alcohol dehydrogenase family)